MMNRNPGALAGAGMGALTHAGTARSGDGCQQIYVPGTGYELLCVFGGKGKIIRLQPWRSDTMGSMHGYQANPAYWPGYWGPPVYPDYSGYVGPYYATPPGPLPEGCYLAGDGRVHCPDRKKNPSLSSYVTKATGEKQGLLYCPPGYVRCKAGDTWQCCKGPRFRNPKARYNRVRSMLRL